MMCLHEWTGSLTRALHSLDFERKLPALQVYMDTVGGLSDALDQCNPVLPDGFSVEQDRYCRIREWNNHLPACARRPG